MILLLILGVAAGLYCVWLLMTFTLHALPLGIALGAAFWLLGHGVGLTLSIVGALAAGIATSCAGPLLLARSRSPVTGWAVMLLFAVPAGVAGHQMIHGLGCSLLDQGAAVSVLSLIGGIVIAVMAGRRVARAGVRMDSRSQ
jgi:hypothetical protein